VHFDLRIMPTSYSNSKIPSANTKPRDKDCCLFPRNALIGYEAILRFIAEAVFEREVCVFFTDWIHPNITHITKGDRIRRTEHLIYDTSFKKIPSIQLPFPRRFY
jgi:hypothetical protein